MTFYPYIKLIPTDNDEFVVEEDCFVREFDIIITKGSITDLTSVPRWLWWVIPPHGKTKKASILHDYLIRSGKERTYSDVVYLYFLIKEVGFSQAIVMYLAINIFKKLRKKHESK
jgi:hypothetical protein